MFTDEVQFFYDIIIYSVFRLKECSYKYLLFLFLYIKYRFNTY